MIIVRYADDVVAGFEHEADARRFLRIDARSDRRAEVRGGPGSSCGAAPSHRSVR